MVKILILIHTRAENKKNIQKYILYTTLVNRIVELNFILEDFKLFLNIIYYMMR